MKTQGVESAKAQAGGLKFLGETRKREDAIASQEDLKIAMESMRDRDRNHPLLLAT